MNKITLGKNDQLKDNNLSTFYLNKKVLVTGHTGFKGSWLVMILKLLGARIEGIALSPESSPNIYDILNINDIIDSYYIDINDETKILERINSFQPDIIFHLAAQAIVSKSYDDPLQTYRTNLMGTATLFDCIRRRTTKNRLTIINVTTDKVYENNEWAWGYREIDKLNGKDPYSNSKSCVEILSNSFFESFFKSESINLINVRAGNVIGGGDFAVNRIIPDCYRAAVSGNSLTLRNPNSIRPYQHVFEPLFAYLYIASKYHENNGQMDVFNIGPEINDCLTTNELSKLFFGFWGSENSIKVQGASNFTESNFLKLDISKIKHELSWNPKMNISDCVLFTVDWYKVFHNNPESILDFSLNQIYEYFNKYYE